VVIVDTTVWIDYLNGSDSAEAEWFDARLGTERFGLLDLMVCEILQGLPTDREAARVLGHLRGFEIFNSGDVDLAIDAAGHYRKLRARGRTVRSTVDCLIAAFCIRGGHQLLHGDRDFDAFEAHLGLRVVHAGAK
jgi:predicted nucleic acid-binding protein